MKPRTSTIYNYARRAVMTLLVVLTSVTAGAYDLTYQIELCKGGVGNIHVKGWVIDPLNKNQSIGDNPNNSIEVSVTVSQVLPNDEAYDPMIWAVDPVVRTDVNSANNCYGTHGFEKVIPVDWGGTLYVWVNARTNQGNGIEEFLLGDDPITLTVTGNDGDGDVNPFLIHNASDWNALASAMTDEQIGNYYADSKYILADDFNNSNAPVSTMFGLATRPFTGTFDGNGKTLNVNLSGPAQYMAPFAYTDGVTIKNLTVAGTFSASSAVYAGGIVGHAATSLNIENCVCSATISGFTCYASGLIALCENMPLTISNCLSKGTFSPGSGGMSHPIALKNPEADVTTPSVACLYVNTTSPSEGLGNHLITGAQGLPVSTTQVAGSWTVPLRAADGVIYYSQAGGLDFCLPLSGRLMVKGWAFDPDLPSESNDVEVHIYSDAACSNEVKSVLLHANHSRPDINETYLIPGSHEFLDFIPIPDVGTYYVKFIATDLTGCDNQQIGDTQEVSVTTDNLKFVKELKFIGGFNSFTAQDVKAKGGNYYVLNNRWYIDGEEDLNETYLISLPENSIGFNNDYFTDLYLSDAPNPVPDELTYNGRTYHLIPYEIFFDNTYEKGNLKYLAPATPLHLYYTREPFGDNRAISHIYVNENSDGAVGLNGNSSQGCILNYSENPEYLNQYLHFTTTTTFPPFTHDPPYSYSFDRPLVEEGWKAAKCAGGTGIKEEQYFHFNSSGTNQYLISSMFESGVPMKLTFNAKGNEPNTRFCIGYSKTGNDISEFTWNEMVIDSVWQQQEYEVPTGTIFVAIKTIENTLDLDDFNFESFYVKASDVQFFAATLTWSVPLMRSFAGYKYQYKKSDEDAWSDEVATQDQFVTLSELTDNTSYDFRVRAIREEGADGEYANFTFRTFPLPSPANLSISGKSGQTVNFTWLAPETEYNIIGYSYQYKKVNDENWSVAVTTTGTSATLTNLDANIRYSFRVKTLYDQYESLYATIDFVVMPYTFGFDRPMAEEGWKMVDNIRDTGIFKTYSGNKRFGFRLHRGNGPQYLVSPSLDCSTFLLVVFTYAVMTSGQEGDIQVGYSTTTDDIDAFTWDTKIFVSGFNNRYEKVFPKGVMYIAVKATYNSDVSNDIVTLDDFSFSECDTPSPHSVVWDECHEHSAQLTWAAPHADKTITGYGYQYKKASESNWSAETTVADNVTTVTLTNLTAATDYDFRVRTLYANNEQSIYLPFSFTTAWELPYECGFENGMNGMHTTNIFDDGFRYSEGINQRALRSGNYGYRFYANSNNLQYLITPMLPYTMGKKLTFYYTCGGIGFEERFQVGYSTTSDDPKAFIWDNPIVTMNYETWTKYERQLPAECRYVAIKYDSSDAYSIYIDDFSIEESSTYKAPANLVATDLPEQIATRLTWTAPSSQPTGYAYQYKKAKDNTWSDLTTTDASTTIVTLNGLTVNTDYQFRVKALYAGGSSNFETVTFVSDAGIEPLPYEWGFENGLGGFRVVNNFRESQVVHFTWHQGTHCFRFSPTNGNGESADNPAQYLVSPQFDGLSAIKLSFYLRISYFGNYNLPAAFQVGYSTTTNNIDDFQWGDEERITEVGWRKYNCNLPQGTKFVAIKWMAGSVFLLLDDFRFEGTSYLHLADNADNTIAISGKDGSPNCTVILDDRTLFLDGDWNTLCLPFALNNLSGTLLEGFEVKELDSENTYNSHKTGVENGTLYLNFKNASSIKAGKPYIVRNKRVTGADANLVNYYALDGTWGYDNEDYLKLVDGDIYTKWCSTEIWKDDGLWSCDFSTSLPVNVTGYTLTGGIDMYFYPDRAPRTWRLRAKVNKNSNWITIDERYAEEYNDAMPTEELVPTNYAIAAKKQGVYQFFRIEIYRSGGEKMQLGELTLKGTLAPGTVADITNPTFSGVTVNKVSPAEQGVTSQDGKITFQGTYAPLSYSSADQSILFLGAGNTLYYPLSGAKIGAQRAYFKLNGVDAGVREFRLNFGDGDEETGISSLTPDPSPKGEGSDYWYTIDGVRLSGKPTKAGLYINGGRKVAIK